MKLTKHQNDIRSAAEFRLGLICLFFGLAGVALNLAAGYVIANERLLGSVVLASMCLIGIGYLPELRKWSGRKWLTRLMNTALAIYVLYVALFVLVND